MTRDIVHKPMFTNQLFGQPKARLSQIIQKIELLREEPHPQGNVKKKLYGTKGHVYRLRSGDYRILYAYDDNNVVLLGVDDRKDVYDHMGRLVWDEPEGAKETTLKIDLVEAEDRTRVGNGLSRGQNKDESLPQRLTPESLGKWGIPEEYFAALCACKTLDDLSAANVPNDVRDRVFDIVMGRDPDEALQEPTFQTGDIDSLVRYVEGDLLGFLLKLDPQQEKMVDWGMQGTGPTLVKGGPGTGKSTVALYRVQAIIKASRTSGNAKPHVLFTTYTKALVHSSKQLLQRLLGDEAKCVEVRTADSVVAEVFKRLNLKQRIVSDKELMPLLDEAVRDVEGRSGAEGRAVLPARIGREYLLEEIRKVIDAREIDSIDAYLKAPRTGRRLPLSETHRRTIWAIYEAFTTLMQRRNTFTWERLRRDAAALIRAGAFKGKYDGVVIDEVQDLDPSLLRLLVLQCAAPNRLFITADANQSIYGGTFRWTDVHEDLRFRGRTELLKRNYRSTRQIGEAAQEYLCNGMIDEAEPERDYLSTGPEPAIRATSTVVTEVSLLRQFFEESMRYCHLTLASCAVLVPVNKTGEVIAQRLNDAGIEAHWMTGDTLDLERSGVKVMNLKSAKGLEFPVVALAGFVENPTFGLRSEADPEEQLERLQGERRAMYVGMTRAMRTLLVVAPEGPHSPLLDGFDARCWNLIAKEVAV